jgi:hypothetical protein
MANISENSVFTATESYEKGINVKTRIFEWSERLQEEVSDLAVELIARYQPVALVWKSLMDFQGSETMGFTYNDCDKTGVLEMAKKRNDFA